MVLALGLAHPYILIPFTPIILSLLEVKSPPQREFHNVHGPEENNGCEDGIGILMECRILKVMIVEGDEYCQADQGKGQIEAEKLRSRIGKGGIAHQTGRVYH